MNDYLLKAQIKSTFFLLLITLIQACVQVDLPETGQGLSIITIDGNNNFGGRPDILSPAEIHRLSPLQIDNFLVFMNNPDYARHKPHRRLYMYLEQITESFEYQGETLLASQVLNLNSGNCLSLAILTTALAKVAGLDIGYQLMDDIPVYEFNSTIVTKGVHVRSIIYDPEWQRDKKMLTLSKPGIKIDYFPTQRQRFIRNLDESAYLSLYYQNIAGEAIIKNDFNSAYWYALESFKYSPDNSAAINMLAVINRRSGNIVKAEQLYLYGIEHSEDKLSLLKNYRILLVANDRKEEARRIELKLDTLKDPSPFNWYHLAQSAYNENDYSRAIRYFKTAIEKAPYLHEAHLGLAQSNYAMGRLSSAESALRKAYENAARVSTRDLYHAKLITLSSEIDRSEINSHETNY